MIAPELLRTPAQASSGDFYTIATLGSHSALQILKGAHDEGFRTLAIANRETERLYRAYAFVDEVIAIDHYGQFMDLVPTLEHRKIVIVPHGSFVAYLSLDDHKRMSIPYFGNKAVLDWEASRELQRQWLTRAGLTVPRQFRTGAEIDRPVIVKLYGAQGGKGYLFLRNAQDFEQRCGHLYGQEYILQEYVIGVPAYIHYFYSPLTGKLEIMSMDRRYETNVDSLGRIPAAAQENMNIEPSYVVVGNSPLVLRESMLAEAYRMGEDVVRVSQEICGPKGLFGAFCIETIITSEAKFFIMEISARIVAGTNPFIDGSPYSYLNYSEPMSTGRRIAREIKNALLSNNLHAVLDDSGVSRRALAALVAAAACLAAVPARAAIETDPLALYATMRTAYDRGVAKGWPFASERYYQSTILDTGRAYSLFRPTDANYGEVANLAVDIATQLHYDPLTNDDAALWYVTEAANYVAKNADDAHRTEATALLAALDAGQASTKVLAAQAESDALANVSAFPTDGDARVALLIADVRAYQLTKDATYRSSLLQHAADPATPLARTPDPEYGEMFAIAASALADPGFTDGDRAAARTIAYRRAHTPDLKVIGRVGAVSHDARLTRTAPADEYFGNLKYSPIGVNNEIVRLNKYLDKGWGYRMEHDALQLDSAVEDWQKQYPRDDTLPRTLLQAIRTLRRVDTDTTKSVGDRLTSILLVQYADSPQARELASS